jgi:uncharacterized RDD family membrane protein YckC
MSDKIIEENAEYQLILPENEISVGKAPMSKRFAAFMIDIFVVFIAFLIPFVTVFSMSAGIISTDMVAIESFIYENFHLLATMEICFDFILLMYLSVSESMLGYTIGKRFFKLGVGKLTYGQAFARNITKAFAFTAPYIAVMDVIWSFFDPEGRRMTEIIARTKVLYEPSIEVEYEWKGI